MLRCVSTALLACLAASGTTFKKAPKAVSKGPERKGLDFDADEPDEDQPF